MNNTDDSDSDEEQLSPLPMHYGALLAMTRPLVITEDTLLSLRGEEIPRSGFGSSPEPADWRADSTLRRGEVLCAEGECDVAQESVSASDQTGSNLALRIYLGMS